MLFHRNRPLLHSRRWNNDHYSNKIWGFLLILLPYLALWQQIWLFGNGIAKRQNFCYYNVREGPNYTTGVSNFSAKSPRKRFIMWCHMQETKILVHFRTKSKLSCNALKFWFGTWWSISTHSHRKYIDRLMITCQIKILVHFIKNFSASKLNFDWFENALKF